MATEGLSVQDSIAKRYREMISSSRLRPGERLPTVRKAAKDLLVSITPVRGAYKILEREGLIYQRRGAGTFVGASPQQAPASLDIGVLFRPLGQWTEDDNYRLQIFLGIQRALEAGRHQTILATMPPLNADPAPQREAAERLLAAGPHGFVLDDHMPDEIIARFAASGRPVVVVNGRNAAPGVGAAFGDMRQAGETAARKIFEKGHRTAACLWRRNNNGDLAAEAFLGVMADSAAAVAPHHVAAANMEGAPREKTYAVFKGIMSQPPLPTAVFCTDDRIARAFSIWARERDLRIPRDLSLVGVLDLAMAARNEPPLTTFRFEPEGIGKAAVEEVVACCRLPRRAAGTVVVQGEWVERESLARVGSATKGRAQSKPKSGERRNSK